jgi:hypothetical protein
LAERLLAFARVTKQARSVKLISTGVAFPLCALLLVAGLAGCGGDGHERAAFIARADALCKKSAPGVPKNPPATGTAIKLYPHFLDMTADDLDLLVTGLSKLKPPKSLRSHFPVYVENLSYMALLAHRAVEATDGGRLAQAVTFVNGFDMLSAENVSLVEKIAFKTCAREGPPKPSKSLVAGLKLTATGG